jgi:biopolymer transport protein ExbB/TolQ
MRCVAFFAVTAFHLVQIVLLVAVVGLVAERLRSLFFRGALEAAPIRRALVGLIRSGRLDSARDLVAAARPSRVIEATWALLDPALPDEDRITEMDDRLFELEARTERGLRALRVLGRVASAIGFVGAAIEIHWVFNGEHGLLRLRPGLVESIGMSHAFLSIALGIATSSFALASWGVLRKQARALVADGRRLLASVEDAVGREPLGPQAQGVTPEDAEDARPSGPAPGHGVTLPP